ncbi:MAG: WbqC family protein [Proteobacteria bacterium]|nr:WbqC family protein [Pseudomonadota bacterium]
MKLAIHQPEFLPWLGFFNKMVLADLYVVFDHVQFKKRYFENRNRIVSPNGEISFIGVPVVSKGRYTQAIKDVEIDNTQKWKEKLLKNIVRNYSKAPYFKNYYNQMENIVSAKDYGYLIDFNMAMIEFFRDALGIMTPMIYSSQLNVDEYKASELILQICILEHAYIYLCGYSGRDYLRQEDFQEKGVYIEWLDYVTPNYNQLCQKFTPYMSTLDLLFNCGEKSLETIKGQGKREEG